MSVTKVTCDICLRSVLSTELICHAEQCFELQRKQYHSAHRTLNKANSKSKLKHRHNDDNKDDIDDHDNNADDSNDDKCDDDASIYELNDILKLIEKHEQMQLELMTTEQLTSSIITYQNTIQESKQKGILLSQETLAEQEQAHYSVVVTASSPGKFTLESAHYHYARAVTLSIAAQYPIANPFPYDIIQVEYHINPILQQRYDAFKKCQETSGIPYKEYITYHGSTATSISHIVKEGFKIPPAVPRANG